MMDKNHFASYLQQVFFFAFNLDLYFSFGLGLGWGCSTVLFEVHWLVLKSTVLQLPLGCCNSGLGPTQLV